MTKTTLQFNATSLKLSALPVPQVNQNPKATERVRKETPQTPKMEEKVVAVSPEVEAREATERPKVIEQIHLKVRKVLVRVKARKVKAKVLTLKQKQRPILKVSPNLKEMPVDLP
jgi:hypothetical protein